MIAIQINASFPFIVETIEIKPILLLYLWKQTEFD
jgi:hypothetical protein